MLDLFVPRAYLNISSCDKLNMSIHVVLRQQNDFDGRDSWCESTLTIRGTELEKEQNAGWWRRMLWRLFSGLVLHCDSNRLKLAENWIRPNWFHEFFPRKFLQIHITSVSGHCMHFTFKCVKSKFSNLIFGGSLTFGPTLCRRLCFWPRHASAPLGEWRYVSQRFLSMVITSLQSLFASKMNERLVEAPL